MRLAPKIPIEDGDPSELPVEIRKALLRAFCRSTLRRPLRASSSSAIFQTASGGLAEAFAETASLDQGGTAGAGVAGAREAIGFVIREKLCEFRARVRLDWRSSKTSRSSEALACSCRQRKTSISWMRA
jgi:hypothetical protein